MPNAMPRQSCAAVPQHLHVQVEEEIELRWCAAHRRPLWEHAVFTLQGVRVTGDGEPRWYGASDVWTEPMEDPRRAYHWRQGRLVRQAEAGRDYDPARHVEGR